MRRTKNKIAGAVAGCLGLVVAAAHAQNPSPAASPAATPAPAAAASVGGISLADALATALRRNSEILVGQTTVTGNQGLLQAASSAFDPKVTANTRLTDDRLADQRGLTADGSVQQLLRDGLVVGGTLGGSTQRPASPGVFEGSGSSANVALQLTFPLLRGRGREVVTASETAQRLVLQSSEHVLRETAAQQILGTTQAYWRLRAAEEALAVQREAESRAERQVTDTQRLIRAGEQPAANINLAQGTLNTRRAARIEAERTVTDARLALGRLLGLEYAQLRTITRAVDPFPQEAGVPIGPQELEALVASGLTQRASLKAAQANLEALRVGIASARDNLQPTLNASLQFGYRGNTTGDNPVQVFGRRTGNGQVVAGLTYQWDVYGNDAKGRLVKATADHDQQAIAIESLKRGIGAGIENAVAAYNSSLALLAQSRETVQLYARAVDGERSKQRLGSATLLDVVTSELNLLQVQIAHINYMLSHAVAIATLRFEAGELVRGEGQTELLPIQNLRAWRTP